MLSSNEDEEEQDLLLSYEEVEAGNPIVFDEADSIQQEQQKDDLISFDQQFKKLIRAQHLLGDCIATVAATTGVINLSTLHHPLKKNWEQQKMPKWKEEEREKKRRKQQVMQNVAVNLPTSSISMEEAVHLKKSQQIWLAFHQVGLLLKIKVVWLQSRAVKAFSTNHQNQILATGNTTNQDLPADDNQNHQGPTSSGCSNE